MELFHLCVITKVPESFYKSCLSMLSHSIMFINVHVQKLMSLCSEICVFKLTGTYNYSLVPFLVLKIHLMNLGVVPIYVHKLPQHCRDILATDRFLYVTDKDGKNLSVVSCLLSESQTSHQSVSNFHVILFICYSIL
jgi:hypothetical protein